MPELSHGYSVEVSAPTAPRVELPTNDRTVKVVAVQGPPGPPGGQPTPHHQTAAASSWTYVHNTGHKREPTVLLDAEPEQPVYPDFEFPDTNTTLIILPEPATGWAYL